MITLLGPDRYPSVSALRAELADAPENGTFTLGGRKLLATEQLQRFQDVGLRIPEWTTDLNTAISWLRSGATVLGRREDHTQGRDIRIQTGTFPNRGTYLRWRTRSEWWCKFVPSTSEWRIHVFDGRVIARGMKTIPDIIARREPNLTTPVRSRRNGWFLDHSIDPPSALRDAGRAAIAATGYLYGAVDMLVTSSPTAPDLNDIVVLEANRLPAMDDYTRAAYATAIRRYIRGSRVPRRDRPNGTYEGARVV